MTAQAGTPVTSAVVAQATTTHADVAANAAAYYILDELFIGGELQESSKKEVLRVCSQIDDLMEENKDESSNSSSSSRSRR
eukprot:6884-Heterococcus_DN1.PRE.2